MTLTADKLIRSLHCRCTLFSKPHKKYQYIFQHHKFSAINILDFYSIYAHLLKITHTYLPLISRYHTTMGRNIHLSINRSPLASIHAVAILYHTSLCPAPRQRQFHSGNCYSMIFSAHVSGFQCFMCYWSSSLVIE